MAISDYLQQYGGQNPLSVLKPSSGGGFAPPQFGFNSPNEQVDNGQLTDRQPTQPLGGYFQQTLGNQINQASQNYKQEQVSQAQPTVARYNAQSAGMQNQINPNGTLQVAPQIVANEQNKWAPNELASIRGSGLSALQSAQNQAHIAAAGSLGSGYNVSIGGNSYDPSFLAPGANPNNPGAQALAVAMTAYKNGTPYVWGGNSLSQGVDCSGLVQQAYAKLGLNLPRTTYEMAKSGRVIGNIGQALPGDLIFYNTGSSDPNGIGVNSHVGLYMGNGQVLEARGTKYGIQIQPLGNYGTIVRPWS